MTLDQVPRPVRGKPRSGEFVFARLRYDSGDWDYNPKVAANVLKCTLEQPSRDAYAVAFSDAEWQRLQAIFPNGVCDWSQPGVGQVGVTVDGSFGPSPVNRIEVR
mgnify:CR=1 FL=1